tara:strand:- start:389 stop:520 length:132 start_codon:yes stop_codon:yes gene_type:complete
MTYTILKKSFFKFLTERHLSFVKSGYKDCGLEKKFPIQGLKAF